MKKGDRLKYISNCIQRILAAPCDIRKLNERNSALAWAVYVAADTDEGLETAHEYLVDICAIAESGGYVTGRN